jgi:hypothetical protein
MNEEMKRNIKTNIKQNIKPKYSLEITSKDNYNFIFYISNKKTGLIRFYIEYSQIVINWLEIILYEDRSKGYGSEMLKSFEKYVTKNYKLVKDLVLIPEHFNGILKNGLCIFYEKNGFIQESNGNPTYIKKINGFNNCISKEYPSYTSYPS